MNRPRLNVPSAMSYAARRRGRLQEPDLQLADLVRQRHLRSQWYPCHELKPLIFFSGFDYDVTLQPVVEGVPLTTQHRNDTDENPSIDNYNSNGDGPIFNVASMKYPKKVVFELHNYQNGVGDCSGILPRLYSGGYNAMNMSDNSIANHAPVVLTEFG